MVGRKFGIHSVPPLTKEQCQTIKVVGISGSSRQQPGMSKSERLLLHALEQYRVYGCEAIFIRLKDLNIHECEGNYSENPAYCTYPCQSSMKYEDDQMQVVYDAILASDIILIATPIRWNNHSSLIQKFVERMNSIENQYAWYGVQMIKNKVAGLIIIGHVDGVQHVAGNLLNFLSWLGFHIPEDAIASWVGENDEDTTKDWGLIEQNRYTQEDLQNLITGALQLAYQLKNACPDEKSGNRL
jgi:multimeric flavodoxin WrbA